MATFTTIDMTVSQLIEELQRMPGYLPCKVLLSEILGSYDDTGQFRDDMEICLNENDAIEADHVSHEGSYVLVRSK